MGRSGSPSRNSTTTSCPMRGRYSAPQPGPAQAWDTRIQQLEPSSFLPFRSQWNWTLMRPCLSVWISSPEGPTTTAVCGRGNTGRAVRRSGREVTAVGLLPGRRPGPQHLGLGPDVPDGEQQVPVVQGRHRVVLELELEPG